MLVKTYLMQKKCDSKIVKIGKSSNVAQRKKQIEKEKGFSIDVLAVIDFDVESDLHEKFKKLRIEGEWFSDNGEIVSFFNSQHEIDVIVKKNKELYLDDKINNDHLNVGIDICQETGFINLSKVVKAYNARRNLQQFNLSQWLKTVGTKELIEDCNKKYGQSIIISRGKYGKVLSHQVIFVDMLMAMDIDFKIEMQGKMMSRAMKFSIKNESGDSYKRMAGALFVNAQNKAHFPAYIQDVANKIRLACHVDDWQTATEAQLSNRDKLHDAISLLTDVLRNNDDAVRIGILKTTFA